MELFNSARHYPLLQLDWQPDAAQQAITAIVNETIAQLQAVPLLPGHPMDSQGFGSDLYFGKAGVLWAINYLQIVGAVDSAFDITPHLEASLSQNRQRYPKVSPYPEQSSYLFGELPLLLLEYKLAPSPEKAAEIWQAIGKNTTQPVRELMWGMAGSMLAAYFMYQWTQEERWQEIFKAQAKILLQEWQPVEDVGYLWTINLYGSQQRYLGPVHGFASNLTPLLIGQQLLAEDEFQTIAIQAMTTLVNTAVTHESGANWAAVYQPDDPDQALELVQYCHGAHAELYEMLSLSLLIASV